MHSQEKLLSFNEISYETRVIVSTKLDYRHQ